MHRKQHFANNQPVLTRAEQVTTPSTAPRMHMLDQFRSSLAQSKHVRQAVEDAFLDTLRGAVAINRTKVDAETNVRKQEIFVSYADRIKSLTPVVVHSAVQINAAIESARPTAYAVIDQASKQAVAVIKQSAAADVISKEDAERRVAECIAASQDDEAFVNNLLLTAKEANRHIALRAVERVKGILDNPDYSFVRERDSYS